MSHIIRSTFIDRQSRNTRAPTERPQALTQPRRLLQVQGMSGPEAPERHSTLGPSGSPWQAGRAAGAGHSEMEPQEVLASGCTRAETSTHLGQRAGVLSPWVVWGKPDLSADAEARAHPPVSKQHMVKVKVGATLEGSREAAAGLAWEPSERMAQPRGTGCPGSSPSRSPGRLGHFGSQRTRPWGRPAAPPRTQSGSQTHLGREQGRVGHLLRAGAGHTQAGVPLCSQPGLGAAGGSLVPRAAYSE